MVDKYPEVGPLGKEVTPKDEYLWPSLGDEVLVMLYDTLITYFFADLREMAKQGTLESEPEALEIIMNLPIKSSDALALIDIYHKNIHSVQKAYRNVVDLTLQHILEQQKSFPQGTSETFAEIIAFDDDNQDLECVYFISINRPSKRCTVSFRGSVTAMDWLKNFQMTMLDMPTMDFQDISKTSELVGIHKGFYDYLFGQQISSTAQVGAQHDGTRQRPRRQAMQNKYETIMSHVAALLDHNPGYRLYVTGHSLGGALATAFAFTAAASSDPRIIKPVTCISVASPKVGNLAFRLATEQLERQRKLRMLRVSNRGDPITLCPEIPYNWCLRSYIKANFRHVGMKLLLRPRWRGGYEIYHPIAAQKTAWYFCVWQFFRSLKHAFFVFVVCLPTTCLTTCGGGRFLINIHGIHEYLWRVNKNMAKLKTLQLNDLYDKYLPVVDEDKNNARPESDIEAAGGSQK